MNKPTNSTANSHLLTQLTMSNAIAKRLARMRSVVVLAMNRSINQKTSKVQEIESTRAATQEALQSMFPTALMLLALPFISNSSLAQYVALQPSANQTIHQPNGTTLTINSLNNVRNPTSYSGVDIGAQINSAIADLPVTAFGSPCGTISIPAGLYSFSTPIVKPQCVFIEGNGANLRYVGTSGAAMVVGSPYSDQNPHSLGAVSHLTLSGVGGTSTSAIGIYLGGDPSGTISPSADFAVDQSFVDDQVFGFAVGVQMGSQAYLDTWRGGAISSNNVGVYFPCNLQNAGKNFSFYGVVVNNGGVGFKQDCYSEIKLYGGAVDYNATALSGAGLYVTAYGTHFEQANAPLIVGQTGSGAQQLNLFGGVLYASAQGGSDSAFITIGGSSSTVNLSGLTLAASAGHGVSSIVSWQGNGQGQLFATALTGATSPALVSGNISAVTVSAAALNTAALPNYSGAFIPSGAVEGQSYVGSATNSNGTLPAVNGTFPYNGTFVGWNADNNGGE